MVHFHIVCFGGAQHLYTQARFSIHSLLHFSTGEYEILVSTDNPDNFSDLASVVKILTLSQNDLRKWKGDKNNVYRAKLLAMSEAAKLAKDKYLYVDTDTFATTDLRPLLSKIDSGTTFMHKCEYPLSLYRNYHRIRHWFANLVNIDTSKSRGYLARNCTNKTWAGIYVSPEQHMWNSGVLGIDVKNTYIFKSAIAILDEMTAAGIHFFAVEQLALSIAFGNSTILKSADNYIYHYWHNKDIITEKIGQALQQPASKDKVNYPSYIKDLCKQLTSVEKEN